MAKILVLAASGFGKSTSIGAIESLGIKGLNPEQTFVVSCTTKPLPFPRSAQLYKVVEGLNPPTAEAGNRVICNDAGWIAKCIDYVIRKRPEIKNIVIDDMNYIMQDYYMANSLKQGYDTFKKIGKMMADVFGAIEKSSTVNFICMGHYEEYRSSAGDDMSYRFKTVGKMTQDFITPEGKFDIVLFGKQSYNAQAEEGKKVTKQFVTNYDGQYPSKSPVGMFDSLTIPNDLGLVISKVDAYYGI